MLTPDQNMYYMISAFGILLFCVAVIVIGIIIVHDIPYKVASKRNNPQKDAIRCMSVLGLIAFPLWLLAMIWAYMKTSHDSKLPLNICNRLDQVLPSSDELATPVQAQKQREQRKPKTEVMKQKPIAKIIKPISTKPQVKDENTQGKEMPSPENNKVNNSKSDT